MIFHLMHCVLYSLYSSSPRYRLWSIYVKWEFMMMTANEWNMVVVAYVVPRGNTSASVPSMHLPSTEPPSPFVSFRVRLETGHFSYSVRRPFPPQLEALRVCRLYPPTTLLINSFISTTYGSPRRN